MSSCSQFHIKKELCTREERRVRQAVCDLRPIFDCSRVRAAGATVEKCFGWLKQTRPIRQVKLRGLHKADWLFVFGCAAHNLCSLPRLMVQKQQAKLDQSCD
ncbi:MAG: transposase [Granulicella sp.]